MINIGIICPSEIAFRRFMPSLSKAGGFRFAGLAVASPEEWFGEDTAVTVEEKKGQQEREMAKAQGFVDNYGGKVFHSYRELVEDDGIDAVYIPLPPALHHKWAKSALENGKHVLVEKPSTTCLADTEELVSIASSRNLAIHENYMFIFHDQIKAIQDAIGSGEIGEVRLYRITFGFPLRQRNDFRYDKALGGGAVLDAGGYCIRYADYLLGYTSKVTAAQVGGIDGFDVEMYGSATMVGGSGTVAQIAFGMDNDYRCEIEIWGSKGTITSNRILTAPDGFVPSYTIKKNQDVETRSLPADDAFLKSIMHFKKCIEDGDVRRESYNTVRRQEMLVEQFKLQCCK